MNRKSNSVTIVGLLCVLMIVLFSTSCDATGQGTNPAKGSGAFATGKYRNLFVENG